MNGGTALKKIKILEAKENDMEVSAAAEIMKQHVRIRADLPKLLAKAALNGYSENVLKALVSWGTGEQPITEIWQEINSLVKNI